MPNFTSPKRLVAVGVGDRFWAYAEALATTHRAHALLVGLCDNSRQRLEYRACLLRERHDYPAPALANPDEFENLIRTTRADAVIVTSPDYTHADYIVRALHAGCNAITEKPMTTDAYKCGAVLRAVRETGRHVRVCFNYRWGAAASSIREVVARGDIGPVRSVHFEYLLSTSHGGDYFRRWHSSKACSGGLLVHKSTHHFDLVNWWIDAVPEQVFALGSLAYYGRRAALARGDEAWTRYPRYTGHDTDADPYALHLDRNPGLKALYLDAEAESGYLRDRNVFRDGIDIEDIMSISVRYRTGALLSYSLSTFGPYEGYRVSLNGDRGRLEYFTRGPGWMMLGQSAGQQARANPEDQHARSLRVLPLFGSGYEVPIPLLTGGHGGADPLLMDQIFNPAAPPETLGRNAGHEQGAASILVGIGANESMSRKAPVDIAGLAPDFPHKDRLAELT